MDIKNPSNPVLIATTPFVSQQPTGMLVSRNDEFILQTRDFVLKTMNFGITNDEFCIKMMNFVF